MFVEIIFFIFIIACFILAGCGFANQKRIKQRRKAFEQNKNANITEIARTATGALYHNRKTNELQAVNFETDKYSKIISPAKYTKIDIFNAHYVVFDNENKCIYIIQSANLNYKKIEYEDIISVEMLKNDKIIFRKSTIRTIGGALVGNALLGDSGAMIGGLYGPTTMKKKIEFIEIKILVRNVEHPTVWLRSGIKPTAAEIKAANSIKDSISVIIDMVDNEEQERDDKKNSVADEIGKLLKLKEAGILNETEFTEQKRKLLE